MKLNQVIAVLKGKKARAFKAITDAYRGWSSEGLKGLNKTYSPLDEDGDRFPDESKPVPILVWDVVERLRGPMVDYYNTVSLQELSNQSAKADIKIGDTILLSQVPVTVLLFLEKQTTDLLTFAKSLPTLPTDKIWTFDTNKNCFVTKPEETTKTQKRPEVVVKYPATPEHPAQVEMFSVDKTVGHWTTVHMSGALPAKQKEQILAQIEQLQDAIKSAREEANNTDVKNLPTKMGEIIWDYIFGEE